MHQKPRRLVFPSFPLSEKGLFILKHSLLQDSDNTKWTWSSSPRGLPLPCPCRNENLMPVPTLLVNLQTIHPGSPPSHQGAAAILKNHTAGRKISGRDQVPKAFLYQLYLHKFLFLPDNLLEEPGSVMPSRDRTCPSPSFLIRTREHAASGGRAGTGTLQARIHSSSRSE